MSVLHLLGSPGDGGAETYFVSLVRALAEAGVEQAAAIHPHPGRERDLAAVGIPVRTLPFDRPIDLMTGPRAAAFARELGSKVLLAWMGRAGSLCPKGPWTRIARLGGYYDLKYYRRMDHLVANTRDIADYLVREGWPAGKVEYIPNFATADEHPPASRSEFDTPEDVPLLLGMGRLHYDKAHDVTLHALTQIPNAWLWIAGSGPWDEKLKKLAASLGVADRVRFLGWREDAGSLYRAADICLFPSRIEPLGNVVIQAWAHGTPIVVAASKGPAALVRDGENGLVTPIDDADALARAANRVLAEPALRDRLREGGLAEIEGPFSQAAVVQHWKDLFARFGAL
jgi:glycosyltransferase involved in cell wall biosynthesis